MRTALIVAAIVVAVAALWLLRSQGDVDAVNPGLPEELADEPDVYLKDANVRQFEVTGALRYLLKATEIRHFERDALTRLIQPDLTLYDSLEPPWEISSERGRIVRAEPDSGSREGAEQVELTERVRLRQSHADGGFIDLRTEALTIVPEQRIAHSDLDVMIDTNVGRTKAVGMHSNLTTGIIRLGSSSAQRVHTIVLPSQLR